MEEGRKIWQSINLFWEQVTNFKFMFRENKLPSVMLFPNLVLSDYFIVLLLCWSWLW